MKNRLSTVKRPSDRRSDERRSLDRRELSSPERQAQEHLRKAMKLVQHADKNGSRFKEQEDAIKRALDSLDDVTARIDRRAIERRTSKKLAA